MKNNFKSISHHLINQITSFNHSFFNLTEINNLLNFKDIINYHCHYFKLNNYFYHDFRKLNNQQFSRLIAQPLNEIFTDNLKKLYQTSSVEITAIIHDLNLIKTGLSGLDQFYSSIQLTAFGAGLRDLLFSRPVTQLNYVIKLDYSPNFAMPYNLRNQLIINFLQQDNDKHSNYQINSLMREDLLLKIELIKKCLINNIADLQIDVEYPTHQNLLFFNDLYSACLKITAPQFNYPLKLFITNHSLESFIHYLSLDFCKIDLNLNQTINYQNIFTKINYRPAFLNSFFNQLIVVNPFYLSHQELAYLFDQELDLLRQQYDFPVEIIDYDDKINNLNQKKIIIDKFLLSEQINNPLNNKNHKI